MVPTGLVSLKCLFRYGSYRSSIYVVLSVLVQQIKKEARCDVFTGVRKLRAQRQGMIQDLTQVTRNNSWGEKGMDKNSYINKKGMR